MPIGRTLPVRGIRPMPVGAISAIAARAPRFQFEGTSRWAPTAGGGLAHSAANRWIAEQTYGIPTSNIAVAGTTLKSRNGSTNHAVARLPQVQSFNPTHLFVEHFVNDMQDQYGVTGASLLQDYRDYVAAVKALVPDCKVFVCTGVSSTDANRTLMNTPGYRDTFNTGLRAALGDWLDGIVPLGDHPIVGTNTAPNDTTLFNADKLHLVQGGNYYLTQVLFDVVNPIAESATAATPILTFESIDFVPTSTSVVLPNRITGMAPGSFIPVSGTDFAVGTGAFGTSFSRLVNGDVLTVRLTSAATNAATVTQTITLGAVNRNISAKTRPAAWPTSTTTLDPANKASGTVLSNGNLTITGANQNSAQSVRSTTQGAYDQIFFEMQVPTSGRALAGVMNSAVGIGVSKFPGASGVDANNGISLLVQAANIVQVYNRGTITPGAKDYINFPSTAASSWVGVAIDKLTGRAWFKANGVWINGNPETRDGGFQTAAPLAQHWAYGSPYINTAVTMNYGATAWNTGSLPLGFAPFT